MTPFPVKPPSQPGTMDVTYGNQGGMNIATAGGPAYPGAGGGGFNEQFILDAMRMKAAQKQQEMMYQRQMMEREMAMREQLQRAQLAAMEQQKEAARAASAGGGERMMQRGGPAGSTSGVAEGEGEKVPVYLDTKYGLEAPPSSTNAVPSGYKKLIGGQWTYFR